MFPLLLVLLAPLTPVQAGDCGNGNRCSGGGTCTSTDSGAGRKYGCAPWPNSTVCNDARFACPSAFDCDFDGGVCFQPSTKTKLPLVESGEANTLLGGADSFCGILAKDLPSRCTCSDKKFGGVLHCKLAVVMSDEIGVQIDVAPCDKVAHMSVDVTEAKHNINYTVAGIQAGKSIDLPIPGLSLDLPEIGNVGLDVSLGVEGSLKELTLKVGFNACGEILSAKVCGSKLTRYLPLWLLHGRYHFDHFCEAGNAAIVV